MVGGQTIRTAILGASGYTGAELVRLLSLHPAFRVVALTGDRKAGQEYADVYPQLRHLALPKLTTADAVDWAGVDLAFCALPHGASQEVIAAIPASVKVVDLSADFRLRDVDVYAEWYGHAHQAVNLQQQAVYGLTEHYGAAVSGARLVANPGCYPTSILLPLIPLLQRKLVREDGLIADSKSGVTGAGRSAKEANLFAEVNDSFHAYGVGSHRHTPEIEQELSVAAGREIRIRFTPHLVPMNRGILSTLYVDLAEGATVERLHAAWTEVYAAHPFVQILPQGELPKTRDVRGSNFCHIGVAKDRLPGKAVIVSVIDNLVKGAAGQAVQNANRMFGLDETTGLMQAPLFP